LGVKERQEREREAVSRSILDAARDLFVAEGYHNVSIRKIAERIEYSPAAIYGYFPSKDDIFFALAEEGFRLLGAGELASTATEDPLDDVRQTIWRLYEFSRQQPEYFALVFLDRHVPRIGPASEQFAFMADLKLHVLARVQRCITEGLFPATLRADVAIRLLWAPVIGITSATVSQRLPPEVNASLLYT
jgi:AcrR family transcriptional regulator